MTQPPNAPHESGIGSNATHAAPESEIAARAVFTRHADGVVLCSVCRTYQPSEHVCPHPDTGLNVCATCRPDLFVDPDAAVEYVPEIPLDVDPAAEPTP